MVFSGFAVSVVTFEKMERGLFGLPTFVSSAGSSGICRKGLIVGSRSWRAECVRVERELGFPPRAPVGVSVSWRRGQEIDSQQWVFLCGNAETWLQSFFFFFWWFSISLTVFVFPLSMIENVKN